MNTRNVRILLHKTAIKEVPALRGSETAEEAADRYACLDFNRFMHGTGKIPFLPPAGRVPDYFFLCFGIIPELLLHNNHTGKSE
jgi:hypothetical protein